MSVNACNGFLKQQKEWVNSQQSNPITIVILNLMPNKKETERQFLNLLDSLDAEIAVQFIYPKTHHSKHTQAKDLVASYATFDEIKHQQIDGLIITGAPIEKLAFSEIDYIDELITIRNWAKTHVKQTINECWAAQQGLNQDFEVEKINLKQKLFGIYQASYLAEENELTQYCETITMPQSRHTKSLVDEQNLPKDLTVIASSPEAGPFILYSKKYRQLYISGHPEYDTHTLHNEYLRDLNQQKKIQKPKNYYTNQQPINTWQASSQQFYQNWLDLIKKEVLLYDTI
ncbi:homoserine O-succinyltransferase [Holzapfeliella sp. He02]|uniref:Homoserine O-acetyltransferase n=1 Tax=Holzapfeliella saturejae TaxID=3082953 RepID=A0ABU8SEN9_9LACO